MRTFHFDIFIMCHEICAETEMFYFFRLEPETFNFFLFSPAGEDKLITEIAAVTSAVVSAITEIKEILYICKWVTGICGVLAVLCGVLFVINYAWRQWRNR